MLGDFTLGVVFIKCWDGTAVWSSHMALWITWLALCLCEITVKLITVYLFWITLSIYYCIQLQNIAFMQKNHKSHSFGISLHLYFAFCGMICEYGCVLMLVVKLAPQTYRSGGVFACFRGGVRWRLLIVKVWIPVGCMWWLMGLPPKFISVPLLLFSVSPAWLAKL